MNRKPNHDDMAPYRTAMFDNYKERVSALDRDRGEKLEFFHWYIAENYQSSMPPPESEPVIADIGCSRGYLLESLATLGYKRLYGVDVSRADVEDAAMHVHAADLEQGLALPYLNSHREAFDVVILRAIVEHLPKDEVLLHLAAAKSALKPDGVAIVDVPNMDWLFAGHERYMDFTHEVGFTRESLGQVMAATFESVSLAEVDHLDGRTRRAWRTRFGRAVLGRLLRWSDPQGASNPIWSRNLIAFGRSKPHE